MRNPTLVVLAAGLSTRYGGPKQLEAVGPDGESLLDYAVYDAMGAGFGDVVLVVSEANEADLLAHFRARFGAAIQVGTVVQRTGRLAGGLRVPARVKPWGTGHAVLCLEGTVEGPFAVANADDFYGRSAYGILVEHLTSAERSGEQCVVGYPVEGTLSEHGGVSRALLETDEEGKLTRIEELLDLRRAGDSIFGQTVAGAPRELSGDELVSMNLWGLTPDVFGPLRKRFKTFLKEHSEDASAEFYLSDAAGDLVARGKLVIRVPRTTDRWLGMTFPEDRGRVRAGIRSLVEAGNYPPSLRDAMRHTNPRIEDSG